MIRLSASSYRYEVSDAGGYHFTVHVSYDEECGGWDANVAFTSAGLMKTPQAAVEHMRRGVEAFLRDLTEGVLPTESPASPPERKTDEGKE